jgi:hypothetical protein
MNYKIVVLLVACMAVAMAAGCTGYSPQSSNAVPAPQTAIHTVVSTNGYSLSEEGMTYAGSAAKSERITQGASSGSGLTGTDTKIIKTASVSLEVKDVTGALDTLKTLAAAQGGYLSSTNVQRNYNNQLSGTTTLRIPQANFESVIEGVKGLGTVKSVSTSGNDVTEEYVDIQAQKTSYTNQLAQYNVIMKQSTRVEDIIAVQEQIDRVQTELDRLDGRLKYLNNRIDVSTITVYLQEPEPVGGQAGHDFVSTLNEGIAGFIGMIDALIILLFTLLPLLILGGIGYGVYRHYRKNHPVVPTVTEEKKDKL